ncbi:MAG: hypothetical protein DMG58_19295 [Acidobacteria bacterium]|nr:MAG: hypothetical protein DMG58_19295 [Acidobacteriota bacterium]
MLAGGIAHDFNNLLTGILGNTSLALENRPTAHGGLQCIATGTAAAERRGSDPHRFGREGAVREISRSGRYQ